MTFFASRRLVLVALLLGCGGGTESTDAGPQPDAARIDAASTDAAGLDAATPDAGNDAAASDAAGDANPASSTYPAPHPALPQVTNAGGLVLASPELVAVTFSNDDASLVAQLENFVSQLGSSTYWTSTTSEYGVGPAFASPAVSLVEAAPGTIDDAAIQSWLASKLNGNDPAFPVASAGSVYVLFYPSSATITLGGQTACTQFFAYHAAITLDAAHGSRDVAYVVVPRCTVAGLTGADAVTSIASGAIVAAATDPYPFTTPAFASVDDSHLVWEVVTGGGETPWLCNQWHDATVTASFGSSHYAVGRTWSNAAALAGHDPCVPTLPGETVYFAAVPVLPDTASVAGTATSTVRIPVGMTRNVELDLFSDAATAGPITVQVLDFAALSGHAARLTFSLETTSGLNGQHLFVAITSVSASTSGVEPFVVNASVGARTVSMVGAVSH